MSQFIDGNTRTFTNGATALAKGIRVVLSSDVLAAAAITEREIGVTLGRIEANAPGVVLLRTAAGTVQMTAAAAITSGAVVYTAASGKISSTKASTSYAVGNALEAASDDGSIIEVLRFVGTNEAES